MPIKLACPECMSTLSVPRKMMGRIVECPCCNAKCRVPAARGAVPPAAVAPRTPPAAARPYEPGWSKLVFGGALAGALLVVVVLAVFGSFWNGGNGPERIEPDNGGQDAPLVVDDGDAAPPPEVKPVANAAGALPARVREILESHCHACHGDGGSNEGGFNFVLRHAGLVEGAKYIVPGDAKASLLYRRISRREMPPADSGEALTDAEIDTLRQWIEAGAATFDTPLDRTFISNSDIARFILADLEKTPERDRRFTRYFTLTNLYNAGFSDDELATYRLALAKLVNSLSWEKELVLPRPVDPAGTILSVDLRRLSWDESTWKAIVAANPYSVMWNAPDARTCRELSNCELPDVRVDWFVSAAARPPLYHEVLQIPKTLKELLSARFGIDLEKDIERDQALRAGFRDSGVSDFNRIVERHRSPYGYFWISYDFDGEKVQDRKDIFSHPLGPGTGSNRFSHAGGEIIFSLPNGMQGYMLVTADGSRLDDAPPNIVRDKSGSLNKIVNGLACMSCHYGGIIAKADEVRPAIEAIKARVEEADDILALYRPQAELEAAYRDDAAAFLARLAQLQIKQVSRTSEPVFNMADRFRSDLNLAAASAELGLKPDELKQRLANTSDTRLVRAWASLASDGRVSRDVFLELFASAVERFDLGVPVNKASPAKIAEQKPEPAPTQNAAAPAPAPPPVTTPPAPNPKLRKWTIADQQVEGELVTLNNGLVELKKADGQKFSEPLDRFSIEDQLLIRATAKDQGQVTDLPPPETQPRPEPKYLIREWVIVFGGKPVHKFEGGFYSVFIGDGDEFPKNVAFAKFIKPNGIVYPDPVALKHLSPPDLDFIRKNYLDEEQFTRLMSTEDPPPPPGVQPQRRLPRPVPMSSRFPPRTL